MVNPVTRRSFLVHLFFRDCSHLFIFDRTSVISMKNAELLFITIVQMKDACTK